MITLKSLILSSIVLGSSLILAGCSHDKIEPTPTPAGDPEMAPVTESSALPVIEETSEETQLPASDAKVIEIEAGSFYYKPAQITVKKGEKIQIVMKSVDMMHDFNIDELNVKLPIVKSGSTGTVEFTADKVGSFEYYCSVGNHRSSGQVGTITVTE